MRPSGMLRAVFSLCVLQKEALRAGAHVGENVQDAPERDGKALFYEERLPCAARRGRGALLMFRAEAGLFRLVVVGAFHGVDEVHH